MVIFSVTLDGIWGGSQKKDQTKHSLSKHLEHTVYFKLNQMACYNPPFRFYLYIFFGQDLNAQSKPDYCLEVDLRLIWMKEILFFGGIKSCMRK
jgi:hypothetical protein